jgi:hypothetical protein
MVCLRESIGGENTWPSKSSKSLYVIEHFFVRDSNGKLLYPTYLLVTLPASACLYAALALQAT